MGAGRPERSFPRTHRLVSSGDFRRAYRKGRRGRSGPFTWHARENSLPHPRLGMAVPKRVVKRATDRSRVKRLIRESFRHNKNRLPSMDVVISVSSLPWDCYDPALWRDLDRIWEHVQQRGANPAPGPARRPR